MAVNIKNDEKALAGARCIIQNWIEAKENEVLHFITDENHIREADIFELAAFECGVVPKITILSSDGVQSGEVIEKMKNTMYYSDVIIGATHYSFITTEAVDYALKKGSRFLSFPMHTNDNSSIFEREFIRMRPKTAKKMGRPVADKITKSERVVVTTKKGTNVAFCVKDRKAGIFAGSCTGRGRVASSSFEVYVPIVETMTNGVVIADGSLGYLGAIKSPVELVFEAGYLVEINGKEDATRLKRYMESFNDKEIYCAAELGIGLNTKSKCEGVCYIEDESTYGTFHIGFGRNIALGGNHEAKGHFDIVTHKPDITADDIILMNEGELVF
ncbi:MAG: peptidase [Lachnoanaerobaculum sp.]|nr:peptidase [Lachnoanaerobaculum sp.]